jgi:hypothetical protein
MTRKAIETAEHYLKCDAPGCVHQETVDGFHEAYIGKPCPVCGSNLLTREDYEAAKVQGTVIDLLNDILEIHDDADLGERQRISINPHAGDLHITIHADDAAGKNDDRTDGTTNGSPS